MKGPDAMLLDDIVVRPTPAKDDKLAQQEESFWQANGAEHEADASDFTYGGIAAARQNHELNKLTMAVKEANLHFDSKKNAIDREKAEVEGMRQDIAARKEYSSKIFKLIAVWLAAVLAVMILNGANIIHISDNVILALIGGTTLNVIGLFLVVANYLFPKSNKHSTPQK